MTRARRWLLPLPMLLAACGPAQDATPGAVTPDEAQALNDAAAMLEDNSVSADALGNATGQVR